MMHYAHAMVSLTSRFLLLFPSLLPSPFSLHLYSHSPLPPHRCSPHLQSQQDALQRAKQASDSIRDFTEQLNATHVKLRQSEAKLVAESQVSSNLRAVTAQLRRVR